MPVQDEEGGENRRVEQRRRRPGDPPEKNGKHESAHDRGERNEALGGDRQEEGDCGKKQAERREETEGTDEAGDRFTAFEVEEDGIAMTKNDGCRSERECERIGVGNGSGDEDGKNAFENVEEQDDQARFTTGGAMNVSCADVAAAHSANVFAEAQADEPVAKWQAAN